MINILNSIKRLLRQVAGLVPTALPMGVPAFNAWSNDIMSTYDMPTQDVESIRFALASIIQHLGQTTAYKPKVYFALTLKAGAAKQVAGSIFYEIKTNQQKRLAEATAAAKASDSGQQQSIS